MDRSNDPTHIRLGINLGSSEDATNTAKLMTTLHEVLSRTLNLVRLAVIVSPILVQCLYIHSVDLASWLMRLVTVYALIGGVCFMAVPEQLYNGMGLAGLRWVFERFYPEIALCNGSLADAAEKQQASLLGGLKVNELGNARARIRWHGTSRYLCITEDGWAVTGDEGFAATLVLSQYVAKDKKVADTYTFRVTDPGSEWHSCSLAFQAINHLRNGGWMGVYRDSAKACPYKVIQDTACPAGTFKLLCANTNMPPPTQRFCTGFYVAEQICGGSLYVGHAQDREAALLELVMVDK